MKEANLRDEITAAPESVYVNAPQSVGADLPLSYEVNPEIFGT